MAVEHRIRESTSAFAERLQGDLAAKLRSLSEELAGAAAEETAAAVEAATRPLADELAALRREADQMLEEQIASVRADAQRAAAEELARVREEADRAAAEELSRVRAEAERSATEEYARIRAEADHGAAEAIARARAEAEETVRHLRQEVDRAVETERARALTEREQIAEASMTDAVAGERQAHIAGLERLAEVIRRLDAGRSLTDVLHALADGAAHEAPRVAILTLHGNRARGWRFVGFEPVPGEVDLELRQAGVIGRAVTCGEVAFAEPLVPGQTVPAGPGFAVLPPERSGLAVPICVGGAPVAILYADDASDEAQPKPTAWPEAIEVMTRHAAVCLENLTAVRTAQALGLETGHAHAAGNGPPGPLPGAGVPGDNDEGGARRYARLLISEIKLYNEGAVRVGRQNRDLLERLKGEIDRARRLFEDRVPAASRHGHFDDELVRTLADGDASLLGRSDALA